MKAIIPAAGFGVRLRPHTYAAPKVLLSVAGKPILTHIIDELTTIGVDEIVLVVGYLGDQIEAFARERYGHLRLHVVPQSEPLGNGHAVYVAREHLDGGPAAIFEDTLRSGRGDQSTPAGPSQAILAFVRICEQLRIGPAIWRVPPGACLGFVRKRDWQRSDHRGVWPTMEGDLLVQVSAA